MRFADKGKHGCLQTPGFTLIELLTVVAVVAILAAMLLPALTRARTKGQAISCQNNLRQLTVATLVYTDDFRDRLPYNLGAAEITKAVARYRYCNWTSPVMSWELDPDNTNRVLVTQGGIGPYTSRSSPLYRCPSDRVVSDLQTDVGWTERVRSISMNAMVGDAGEYSSSGANVNNPYYVQFFKLSQIGQPSSIFLFIEEHPDSINDGYFVNRQGTRRWTDLPASYHAGAASLTFADGHAELRTWRFRSTKPAPRPDAAQLPFAIPAAETGDYDWLMQKTSTDADHPEHED